MANGNNERKLTVRYHGLLDNLGRQWQMLVYVVNVCQFSLLVLVAGAALLFADQGQDLLLSTAEDRGGAILEGSLLLWAFSIWLWTRTLLEIKFPSTPAGEAALLRGYRIWTPRVLGLLPFVLAAWALGIAGHPASGYAVPTLLVGVVFALMVVFRRWAGRRVARLTSSAQPDQSRVWVDEMAALPSREKLWSGSGILDYAALALAVAGVVLLVWGLVDPLSLGNVFNALVLLMAWCATFLPLGSVISYWANRERLPFMSILIIFALASSGSNDNHAIRPLAGDPGERATVGEALDAWAEAHCGSSGECGNFIVVATAGGGIRAAYWTGTVLAHLEDKLPSFHDRVFAISGISGGSVGASVYRAVLAGKGKCDRPFLDCTTDVLKLDSLSPLSASLLYRELPQRFIPMRLFADRAGTFETAWEEHFRDKIGTEALGQSFAALGKRGQTLWPALFLNATWSETGRRIVASTLRFDGEAEFKLANDQLKMLGYDIRLSTAAHNSARFPYVSPPGSWHEGKGEDKTAGKVLGRLQDGGLYENYGAVTALEILNFAKQRLAARRYTPVVIQISSDPTLGDDFMPKRQPTVKNYAYEVLTTVRTVFNTRVAHGEETATRLREWAESRGKYEHFRMCDSERDDRDPPLGWSLSKQAEDAIQGYIKGDGPADEKTTPASCRSGNERAVERLRVLLSGRAGQFGAK